MRYQNETPLWVLSVLLSPLALAQAGVLDDYTTVVARSDEPRLIVTYSDGGQETYQPEWRATLTVHREEPGHVAKPLQGDLVDTRECRWSIHGQIERSLRLCTRGGCAAKVEPSAALAAPGAVTALDPIQREPPPLAERILRLAPDLCTDTDAQFRADVETQRARLLERFQQQLAIERARVAQPLAQLPGVQAVEPAPPTGPVPPTAAPPASSAPPAPVSPPGAGPPPADNTNGG